MDGIITASYRAGGDCVIRAEFWLGILLLILLAFNMFHDHQRVEGSQIDLRVISDMQCELHVKGNVPSMGVVRVSLNKSAYIAAPVLTSFSFDEVRKYRRLMTDMGGEETTRSVGGKQYTQTSTNEWPKPSKTNPHVTVNMLNPDSRRLLADTDDEKIFVEPRHSGKGGSRAIQIEEASLISKADEYRARMRNKFLDRAINKEGSRFAVIINGSTSIGKDMITKCSENYERLSTDLYVRGRVSLNFLYFARC
ncbi:MAG: hypothetical protein GY940_41555, partial [bacterium]|nr:hypothetical protein [bacterium]